MDVVQLNQILIGNKIYTTTQSSGAAIRNFGRQRSQDRNFLKSTTTHLSLYAPVLNGRTYLTSMFVDCLWAIARV